jgi:hypothetical protein
MDALVLHTTRGTLNPQNLEDARQLHNAFVTQGPQPGIEIARSLGDLSHNLYSPADGAGDLSDAKPGELLFIDYWAEPDGMETFFSHPSAQEAGDRLYASREETEWKTAPPRRFSSPHALAYQHGLSPRFIAMVQATIRSVDDTLAALETLVWANLGAACRRGQLSHHLFVRHTTQTTARPASNTHRSNGENIAASTAAAEILVVDFWPALTGLNEHYNDTTVINGLRDAVAGPLAMSVWQQASGFAEW